ncbi:MAG: hypothetical protein M1490_01555 [Candidatus Bathyarchaeota archaeon]|nr:hypothetical protein [Candidatus Bathyarchaeota archaeon]
MLASDFAEPQRGWLLLKSARGQFGLYGVGYLITVVCIRSEKFSGIFLYAKSFKQNTTILSLHMSLETFNCPYCDAQNKMQINEVTITDTVTIKALEHQRGVVSQIPIYQVTCRGCLRDYEPIKFSDYGILKRNFQAKSEMLESFKIKFPNEPNLNRVMNNIVAIARPKSTITDKVFRKKHLHMFFTLDGVRAYIDCEQVTNGTQTILRGLNIGDV